MSRATMVQAAVVAVLVWVMLLLLTGGGADRRETPAPARTWGPATEQEQREWTEEQLYERLRRQQQEEANR